MADSKRNPQASEMDDTAGKVPDLKTLRSRIPSHCFQPSLWTSLQYVIRDLCLMSALFWTALWIPEISLSSARALCWIAYSFVQGLVFTGIWILAHECGHDSFSTHRRINAAIGFVLHSIVLVPFFSWKYSHSRHHRFANHMEKDTVFAPQRKEEYRSTLSTGSMLGHTEDAPLVSLLLLLAHQLLGWPLYITVNAGAGASSLVSRGQSKSARQSHLDPWSHLFYAGEARYVLLSNVGLFCVLLGLWCASKYVGAYTTCLLYGLPYLWMNHWLVAITYLHHTHPDAPHYEEGSWTFQQGALSTIDREFGFIGRHMFHGIIEYHVIHHLFPRIPFYHAEEATEAIAPLLGKVYIQQKTSFLQDLWTTFTTCNFVVESSESQGRMDWVKAT